MLARLIGVLITTCATLGAATWFRIGPTEPPKPPSVAVEIRTPTSKPAAKPREFSQAELENRLKEVRETLPAGFVAVIEKPFIVIGDESEADVRSHARGTVRFAVERLKRAYFPDDPEEILDVWLFKDADSYRTNVKKIFNHEPDTPFGYYSPGHRALIMNIGTGGGTLVHEIVHPFMAANFPKCPAWFNEGMGSLYEQSADRRGEIVGQTNWRLFGLQKAIRAGKTPTFEALTSTTDHEFYNEDRGTNYAQARYLLYYMQQKKLLHTYYKEFRANRERDPTGYETLKRVLGETDMKAFQQRWEKYVLELRFP